MLIKTDPSILIGYAEDYSGLQGAHADVLMLPESEADVIEALTRASASHTPLTVSGAGTGVTGGRLAFGGIVLGMERLNRIKEVSAGRADPFVIVEPGVTLQQLGDELQKHGLWYPVNPTERAASIGGNVSTNASGSYSFRYGPTRRYVRRLRVVLTTGDILDITRGQTPPPQGNDLSYTTASGTRITVTLPEYRSPGIKNAAGYFIRDGMDPLDLFIGQEGTLGVVTEIELSVLPLPAPVFQCHLFLPPHFALFPFIDEVRARSSRTRGSSQLDIDARALEYLDKRSLDLIRDKFPRIPPAAGLLSLEQESPPASEERLLEAWLGTFESYGLDSERIVFAQSSPDKEYFARLRHSVPESINELVKKAKRPKIGSDLAVPGHCFGQLFHRYEELFGAHGSPYFLFGHIGEHHLHANILPSTDEEERRAHEVYTTLVASALACGGTVTAEHGIGKVKHTYLEMMFGRAAVAQMAALKKRFDPACILGLDNLFPRAYLKTPV